MNNVIPWMFVPATVTVTLTVPVTGTVTGLVSVSEVTGTVTGTVARVEPGSSSKSAEFETASF